MAQFGYQSMGFGSGASSGAAYDLDSTYGISVVPLAHWDASALNGNGNNNAGFTDGDGIPLWVDRTQTYSLKQATASAQFLHNTGGLNGGTVPSAATQGARASTAIVYDAAGSSTATLSAAASSSNVYHAGSVTAYQPYFGLYMWIEGTAAADFKIMYTPGGNNPVTKVRVDDDGGSNITEFTSTTAFRDTGGSNEHWFEVRNTDDTNELDCRINVDGVAVQDYSAVDIPTSLTVTRHGYNHVFNGQLAIGEVLFFDTSLGDPDRAIIESYLNAKYGITDS